MGFIPLEAKMLRNEKILITGPSSQVAFPIARALAGENTVYGLARLSAAADRERLEAVGVRCIQSDLATDSFACPMISPTSSTSRW